MAKQNNHLFAEFNAPTTNEWYDATVNSLKGKPFDKLIKTTYEGFDLKPMYRAEDIADLPHVDTLPGEFPYTRGTKSDGYLSEAWWIAQSVTASTPQELNATLKHDLGRGQTAINIGYEHLLHADDLAITFADIDLTQYPLLIDADCHATDIYHALSVYLGDDRIAQIRGCIGYDPVRTLARDGQVSSALFDRMAELTKHASQQSPSLDTIAIHTDTYHNAGANAVQEIAIAAATGVTYITEMMARGLDIDQIAPKMRFFLNVGEHFFMEIAKLRAIKMIWAQIVHELGGNAESAKIKLHVKTADRNKTRYEPYVNMLRVTTEALAGALGGVDSLEVTPFDHPLGEPDEFSRRISRNVQLILQNEVNLTNLIDPAGGSWYVEHVTHQLAQSAWSSFQQIEAQGGIIDALVKGTIQQEIHAIFNQHQDRIHSRRDVLVGTNMYANFDETQAISRTQARYDIPANTASHNVIKATPLMQRRFSASFEQLRANSEQYQSINGHRPQLFIANFGVLREYKARMDFTRGFYEVGGFELIDTGGFNDVESAVHAAVNHGVSAVVICSTDGKYVDLVPEFVPALKAQKPDVIVILAGYPQDKVDDYRQDGVDDFIHIKADCYAMNKRLQDKLGVSS
jgi:methylmalonyl-CoA mutase